MESLKLKINKLTIRVMGLKKKNESGRGLSDSECVEYRTLLIELRKCQDALDELSIPNSNEGTKKLAHTM